MFQLLDLTKDSITHLVKAAVALAVVPQPDGRKLCSRPVRPLDVQHLVVVAQARGGDRSRMQKFG